MPSRWSIRCGFVADLTCRDEESASHSIVSESRLQESELSDTVGVKTYRSFTVSQFTMTRTLSERDDEISSFRIVRGCENGDSSCTDESPFVRLNVVHHLWRHPRLNASSSDRDPARFH